MLAMFFLLCVKMIEKNQNQFWIQIHIIWDTYVFTYSYRNPLGLWLDMIYCVVTKDNDHKFMQMSLNVSDIS